MTLGVVGSAKNEEASHPLISWKPINLEECSVVVSLSSNPVFRYMAAFGPHYALLRGLLEAQGNPFEKLPIEDCPTLRWGLVAWVGSGPSFFISLANYGE
ncbi:unnamed protein product [Lupinus luteus]|uniref:Uncharacterized protein n=1 Tax=Lupinus luteus TaxID=3873 RepID=A0AAV1XUB1_LUPLU